MKKLSILVVLFFAILLAYWYGYRVGFEEATVLGHADIATHGIDAIQELNLEKKTDPQDLYEIQINEAITSYGQYLQERSIPVPGFYSVKPVVELMFTQVIRYRDSNPRIVDGIEYSPLNPSIKEMTEYQELSSKYKEKLETEVLYFKRAMDRN